MGIFNGIIFKWLTCSDSDLDVTSYNNFWKLQKPDFSSETGWSYRDILALLLGYQ